MEAPCLERCVDKPILMPENEQAMRVFNLCRDQVIVSVSGFVDMLLPSVKVAMDLIGVDTDDQLRCAEKVMALGRALYRKEESEETPPTMGGEDKDGNVQTNDKGSRNREDTATRR